MAKVSFTLPCKASWTPGIYRLETSDPVMGYDPVLGTDGPANTQWQELGDRTLFLRKAIETCHKDGCHALTFEDFKETTQLPESALALDYSTAELATSLYQVIVAADDQRNRVEEYNDFDLNSASILSRLVPYCREYFKGGCEFELFNDAVSFQGFTCQKIEKEIRGDDSLDLSAVKGVNPGQTYFLFGPNGEDLEEATVLSVLTDKRVRFTTALKYTRSEGYLCSASMYFTQECALVPGNFYYISDWLDNLIGTARGKFYVHRENTPLTGRLFYQLVENGEWIEADKVEEKHFFDGSLDDVFVLPPERMRLRLEYENRTRSTWQVHYFALKGEMPVFLPETVRKPEISGYTRNDRELIVRGGDFASLWHRQHKASSLRLSMKNEYEAEPKVFDFDEPLKEMTLTIPYEYMLRMPLLVELRYQDTDNMWSRWSEAREII